jgi:hypothetical protein
MFTSKFTDYGTKCKINKIYGIKNDILYKKFENLKERIELKRRNEDVNFKINSNIQNLFHGTTMSIIDTIYSNGFIIRKIILYNNIKLININNK